MAAEKRMLRKGQNPLEMDFTEHRPNYGLIALIGIFTVCSGACCIGAAILIMGALK